MWIFYIKPVLRLKPLISTIWNKMAGLNNSGVYYFKSLSLLL